jgi:hypothetical protein
MKRALVLLIVLACGKKAPEGTAGGAPGTVASDQPRVAGPVKLDIAEVPVPSGKSALHIAWSVPNGTDINDDAPFNVRWSSSDGLVSPPDEIHGHGKDVKGGFDVPIDVVKGADGAKLAGDIDLVVCDIDTHSVCVPLKRKLELTFAVGKGGPPGSVTLALPKAKP